MHSMLWVSFHQSIKYGSSIGCCSCGGSCGGSCGCLSFFFMVGLVYVVVCSLWFVSLELELAKATLWFNDASRNKMLFFRCCFLSWFTILSSISPNKLIFTLFGACLRSPTQRHGVRTLFRNSGNLRRLRPSAVLRTIPSNEVRTLRTSSTVSHTVRHLWSESANAKKRGAFSSYVLASTGSTDYNQQPQTTTITTATIATTTRTRTY